MYISQDQKLVLSQTPLDHATIVKKVKAIQLKEKDTLPFREILKKVFREGKAKRTDFIDSTFIHTEDTLLDLFNCVKKQRQAHYDFVSDFVEDVNPSDLERIMSLEDEIKKAAAKAKTPEAPKWFNYPMTPVASSYIKGAGAYKGKLLLEFHHDPGTIWGFDVNGKGSEFYRELMYAGSKGGWVWDKLLGRPSEYGMKKGKFYAYKDQGSGNMKFYTSPGAQFVHKFGRPAKFTYNPVGYMGNEFQYTLQSEIWKEWKESVVEPPKSREPISQRKLTQYQRKRNKTFGELQSMLKERMGDFREDNIQELIHWVEKNVKNSNNTAFQHRLNPITDLIAKPISTKIATKIGTFQHDAVPLHSFTLKNDMSEDFVILHGAIVRDGPYVYSKNGKQEVLYKDIKNLADIYSRYDYLPVRASEEIGAHHSNDLGYATNFTLNKETHEIEADLVLVNDDILKQVIKKGKRYHVSPGYNDYVIDNVQYITDLDHVALSLGEEMGRACTGTNEKGVSCTKVEAMEVG